MNLHAGMRKVFDMPREHVPLEKDVQRSCRRWLEWWGAFVIRINSGGLKVGDRFVQFNGVDGCSDLLVVMPDGVFAAVEVKRPGKKPNPASWPRRKMTDELKREMEQVAFLAAVRKRGGLGLMVDSVDDLKAQLEAAGYDVRGRVA